MVALTMGSVAAQVRDFSPVTDQALLNPDPADWLMPSRTYDWQRFSPLDQVHRANVQQLRLAWARGMGPGVQETIPIVRSGVMFVVNPGGIVQALEGATGDVIWEYRRELGKSAAGARTRSLAIYEDLILYAAPDGYLVALDARTGRLRWETRVEDPATGTRHTSPPIVAGGKVLTGRACSRARCFITAHDVRTGKEVWRTYTSPTSDEPGGNTWGQLAVDRRVASPWGNPGSYDSIRRLVYWGIANPTPYTRIARHQGNADAIPRSSPSELYSNSTVALSLDTGKVVWYYQHSPGDDWDLDHVQERILVRSRVEPDPKAVKWINPAIVRGQERDLVVTVSEAGGVWVLDRETGGFLWATPFPHDVPEFHIARIDVTTGQTFLNWDLVARKDRDRSIVCYHNTKGYWPMAYDPKRNSLYVGYNDYCLDQTANTKAPTGTGPRVTTPRPDADPQALGGLAKIDVATGRVQRLRTQRSPGMGATLVTAGDLVFWGDLNRRLYAFDADSGKVLWETVLGGTVQNSTISYAVNGRQYVAVLTGEGSITGGILQHVSDIQPPRSHNAIYVFALPESPR
jgi:alcohol dehydrogenase (cytochrome c)